MQGAYYKAQIFGDLGIFKDKFSIIENAAIQGYCKTLGTLSNELNFPINDNFTHVPADDMVLLSFLFCTDFEKASQTAFALNKSYIDGCWLNKESLDILFRCYSESEKIFFSSLVNQSTNIRKIQIFSDSEDFPESIQTFIKSFN